MSITIHLQDDVYEQIAEEAKISGRDIHTVVNERLRIAYLSAAFEVSPFRTSGFAPGVDENKLSALLDTLETRERKR
jgi:hypothetical protein